MSANHYNEEQRPIIANLNGKGPYIVTQLTVKESISGSSHFIASLISADKISEKILGKVISIQYSAGIEGNRKKTRRFFALISSLENIEFSVEKQLYKYRIEAIDPLSIFAFRTTNRSFQGMTSKQIIENVLSDSGLKGYFKLSPRTAGNKHDYCIQFNETDLNFIKRLMAFEGWHYHCNHTGNQPSVVIADNNQDFDKADNDKIPFIIQAKDKVFAITHWHCRNQLGATKLSLADHNEELAECLNSGNRNTTAKVSNIVLSADIFGQGNSDKSGIRDAAKRQMESIDCQKTRFQAQSAIPSLGAGLRFNLTEHTDSDYNQEYVIIQAEHYFEAHENGASVEYKNSFKCIPFSTPWRPPFINKPSIHNIQSAEVTGPSGEDVNQDKLGRIKVHFHWDKDAKKDENSSCWIPVAQATASNGFGVQFIPRIGDEVLISFINGDPDRPVVSGSVYNGKNKPPYNTATQSGIKTRTTPNGSANTANELRFEDKKDKEEIFLQAEKDFTMAIKNDLKQTIKGIAHCDVEKTMSWKSKEAMTLATEEKLSASATKDLVLKSDATITSSAGKNNELSASSQVSIDGQTIELKGKSKIILSVGSSSIELSQGGITLSGAKIVIEGKAKVDIKAAMIDIKSQAKASVKGAIVEINGSAMTQVKAGAMWYKFKAQLRRLINDLFKDPHKTADEILRLYEPSDELKELAAQHNEPATLIKAGIDAELFGDIVIFLAHALPVREAIWWACCSAEQRQDWNIDEANAIRAAKAWVHAPDETSRRFAEQMAIKAELQTGAGWVAQAAFWSGGSMIAIGEPIIAPPEYLYSHAVAGAINLSAVMPDGLDAKERYSHYFAMGLNIAHGGNGRIGV